MACELCASSAERVTMSRTRRLCRSLLFSSGLLLLVLALPSHAAARCFGVPEGLQSDSAGSWFLKMNVTTANGFQGSVSLGFHPNATDGFDRAYDQFARPFDLSGGEGSKLAVYFYYPNGEAGPGGSSETGPTSERLRISTVQPRTDMSWPLQVFYFFGGDTVIQIQWNSSEASDLEGYEIDLHLPSGGTLSMAASSTYSFQAAPGFHNFLIDAHGASEQASSDALLLVGTLAVYGAVVAIIFVLRRARRRRG